MPRWDIFILSWLTIVNEFRTTYYNDIMNIKQSIHQIAHLLDENIMFSKNRLSLVATTYG